MTVSAFDPAGTQSANEEELEDLRSALRDFLADTAAEETVRAICENADGPGHDPKTWAQLSNDLGLTRLALPERFGGDGYGFAELRVVLEELGASLLPSPFLASAVVAAQALLSSGDADACDRYLPSIGDGTTIATLALMELSGTFDPRSVGTEAAFVDDQWFLTGRKTFVMNAQAADLLLVVARTPAGVGLFATEADAPGVGVRVLTSLDATRPLGEVVLSRTPAHPIGQPGAAIPALERTLDLWSLALAAEQVGGARRCLETATAYAKERKQFGRAIGSFQAIKHKLADMLTKTELADAAIEDAVLAESSRRDDAPAAAAAAYISASEAFEFVAAENIQVHGGIGFTWEHSAHLYFRRARADQNLLGGPSAAQERLLSRMGV